MNKLYCILLALALFSCKQKNTNGQNDDTKTNEVPPDPYLNAYGNWVGDFIAGDEEILQEDFQVDMNKINISIKKIVKDSVFGESIVAGNKRSLKGTVSFDDKRMLFVLSEPGDNKYDGIFEFGISGDSLFGVWTAFNKKIKVTERKYSLTKKEFVYNSKLMLPDSLEYVDYVGAKTDTTYDEYEGVTDTLMEAVFRMASDQIFIINASEQKLTEKQLKNLKKIDLEILRNTIYARHGYTFKKKSYRQFFDYVGWYIPQSTDVEKELTQLEKENIALLKRFEKYAEDNYDSFGR